MTQRAKARAEALFMVYWQLGPTRSLERLHEFCSVTGMRVSLSTVKNYSQNYGWQRKLLEIDQKAREAQESATIAQVAEMNLRHAQIARGLLGIAFAGMKKYHSMIQQSADGSIGIDIDDMVKLYRAAQTGERLALGEATSRVETWTRVVETVVREFGLIFITVNEIADKEARQHEYIRLSDDMIRRYYREQVKTQDPIDEIYTEGGQP